MSNPSIKVLVDSNSFKDKAAMAKAFGQLQSDLNDYCQKNPLDAPVDVSHDKLVERIKTAVNTAMGQVNTDLKFTLAIKNETDFLSDLKACADEVKKLGQIMDSSKITVNASNIGTEVKKQLGIVESEFSDGIPVNINIKNKEQVAKDLQSIYDLWDGLRESFRSEVSIGANLEIISLKDFIGEAKKSYSDLIESIKNDKLTGSVFTNLKQQAEELNKYLDSISTKLDTLGKSKKPTEVQANLTQSSTGINGIVTAGKNLANVPRDLGKFNVPTMTATTTASTTQITTTDTESVPVTPKLDESKFSGFQALINAYFTEKPLEVPVKVDNEKLVQAFNDVETAYTNFTEKISTTKLDATGFEELAKKASGLVSDLKGSLREVQKLANPTATTGGKSTATKVDDNKVTPVLDTSGLGGMQTAINNYCAQNPLKADVTVDQNQLTNEINKKLELIKKNTKIPFEIQVSPENATELETALNNYKTILEQFSDDMAYPPSLDGLNSYIDEISRGIDKIISKIKELKDAGLSKALKTDLKKVETANQETKEETKEEVEEEVKEEVPAGVSIDSKQIIEAVNAAIAETNIDSFDKVKIGVEVTKESVQEAIKNAGLSEITAEVKKALKDAEPKTENKIVKKPSKKAEKIETKTEEPAAAETTPVYTKEGNLAKLEQYKKQLQSIKDILTTTNPDDKLVDNAALANLETAEKALEDLVAQYNRLRNVDKRGALLDGDMASAGTKLADVAKQYQEANKALSEQDTKNNARIDHITDYIGTVEKFNRVISKTSPELIGEETIKNVASAKTWLEETIAQYEKLNSVGEQTEWLDLVDGKVTKAYNNLLGAEKNLVDANKSALGSFKNVSEAKFLNDYDVQITEFSKKLSNLKIQLNDQDFAKKLDSKDNVADLQKILSLYDQIQRQQAELTAKDKLGNYTLVGEDREATLNSLKANTVELTKQFNIASKVRTAYAGQIKEQDKVYTSMTKLNTFVEKYKDELSKIPYLWERINRVQSKGSTMDSMSLQKEVDSIIAAAQSFGVQTETMFTRLWARIKFNVRSGLAGWGTMLISTSFRELYNNVKDLDTAMTELRKVTDETEATYTKFLENAADRAQKLGASLTDVVSSTSDFARLGYSLTDATTLSDAATIYLNVGDDVEDIDQATKSIVSTMQGFGLQTSEVMGIVDEFNEVSNNYASSAGDIGEITQRSAAAMAAAGSSLEETIALGVTANTVAQDKFCPLSWRHESKQTAQNGETPEVDNPVGKTMLSIDPVTITG